MKIKTQFLVCLVVFTIVLLVITASVIATGQQVSYLDRQQEVAGSIERGASSLNSITIDYFLYQEDLQLSRWETTLSLLLDDLGNIIANNADQQALINNVESDLQGLRTQFADVVTYLQNAPRNVSVRIDPAFQFRWSGMALQSQNLAFDASQLSNSINVQTNQLNTANILLILSLSCAFGAFLATIYFIAFRKTLKTVTKLQNGIDTIGTGNLDHRIEIEGNSEIAHLSRAFNQMTANLKTATASKAELEREITERRRAEEALGQSERKYRRLYETSQDGIMARDFEGNMIDCNPAYTKMLGYTKEELQQLTVFQLIPEKWHEERERIVKQIQSEGDSVVFEREYRKKDGSVFPASVRTWPLTDDQGGVIGVWSIVRDISEQKELQKKLEEHATDLEKAVKERTEELQKSALYSRNLIEASLDPLVTINNEGKITDVNKATELVTGYSRNQLINSDFSSYFTDPEKASNGYRHVFAEGYVRDYPLAIRDKSGKVTDVLYNASLYRNEKGEIQGIFAAARDITERKNLERQLQEKERLATIGATAGMVGHDIRNPLQAITGDIYLARSDLESIPDVDAKVSLSESLEAIQENVNYISKIVQDLQDYARQLNPVAKEVNLKPLFEDVLLKTGIPANIRATCKVEKNAKQVDADPELLRRIISNLVSNAVQAMPKAGRLTIETHRDKSDIVIEVQDTGLGIPEDLKPKLFSPLFTTKARGQGFGLAVVKRVTESMNGTISFESQEGKGAKFIVRLPHPKKRANKEAN